MRGLETRTERVYLEVNGNPRVSTPGGRQQGYIIYHIQFTDTQKWWWLEDWIEPKTEYEAF